MAPPTLVPNKTTLRRWKKGFHYIDASLGDVKGLPIRKKALHLARS